MATFVLTLPVQSPEEMQIENFALGASTSTPLTDDDIGKAVGLSTANNMVQAAKDAEIEGIVDSVSAETVNGGFGFGGVQRDGRALATVGASEAGTVAVGELLVVDTQEAVNTANANYRPKVYPGSPSVNLWRCIRIVSGTGAAGDTILMERQ